MLLQRIAPFAGPALLMLAFAAASPARAQAARLAYGYGETAASDGPVFDLRGRLPTIDAPAIPAPETDVAPPTPARPASGEGEAALCAAPAAQGDLSATHASMPVGALVFVTDLDTHKEVIVRVSGRGVTQLSPRAAAALDCHGRARVSIRYLGVAPTSTARPAAPAPAERGAFMVQIGAFGERDNAERAKDRADSAGRASIEKVEVGSRTLYRVRLGPWDDRADADRARAEAVRLGFGDAKVTGH